MAYPEAPFLTANQRLPIINALMKLRQVIPSEDIPVSDSHDGALTLYPEDIAKFPGAQTVHVWILDNHFKVDIVMKDGQVRSKDYTLTD